MYDFILILHFLGLAMGAGTSFYMLGLALHARRLKDPEAAKKVMLGAGAAITGIGLLGLILLLASGYFLLMQSGIDIKTLNWAFWMKMAMVAAILIYTVTMKIFAIKAKRREAPRRRRRNRGDEKDEALCANRPFPRLFSDQLCRARLQLNSEQLNHNARYRRHGHKTLTHHPLRSTLAAT